MEDDEPLSHCVSCQAWQIHGVLAVVRQGRKSSKGAAWYLLVLPASKLEGLWQGLKWQGSQDKKHYPDYTVCDYVTCVYVVYFSGMCIHITITSAQVHSASKRIEVFTDGDQTYMWVCVCIHVRTYLYTVCILDYTYNYHCDYDGSKSIGRQEQRSLLYHESREKPCKNTFATKWTSWLVTKRRPPTDISLMLTGTPFRFKGSSLFAFLELIKRLCTMQCWKVTLLPG